MAKKIQTVVSVQNTLLIKSTRNMKGSDNHANNS